MVVQLSKRGSAIRIIESPTAKSAVSPYLQCVDTRNRNSSGRPAGNDHNAHKENVPDAHCERDRKIFGEQAHEPLDGDHRHRAIERAQMQLDCRQIALKDFHKNKLINSRTACAQVANQEVLPFGSQDLSPKNVKLLAVVVRRHHVFD